MTDDNVEWTNSARRQAAQLVRCPGMKLPVETVAQTQARQAAMYRASGSMKCSCGWEYRQHPNDENYDFLHVLCNGDRVKL